MKNRPERWLLLAVVLIVYGIFVETSCAGDGSRRSKSGAVEAVFLNEANSITVMTRDTNGAITPKAYRMVDLTFYADAKPDDKIWIDVTEIEELGDWQAREVAVHVHSMAEIQGGGWNHANSVRVKQ